MKALHAELQLGPALNHQEQEQHQQICLESFSKYLRLHHEEFKFRGGSRRGEEDKHYLKELLEG